MKSAVNSKSRRKSRSSTPGDLVLRSLSFFYVFLLIVLPLIAISSRAFSGGLEGLWRNIVSPQALYSLKLTFIVALVMVVVNVVTGTATAWVLVRYDFPLKNLMNALIDLPFAIPTVVTGIMLVALYGPNGLIGGLFGRHGIEIMYAKPGIVLALLYVSFPFVVRTVQPVMIELDKDMEEAASTLGARPLVIFRRVVLPSLTPAILTGAALSFSRAIGEFGSIAIVSGNIPYKTQVASVYIYGELESYNPQGALGMSMVLLICSFLILILLNRLQVWNRRHEHAD
ncbi:MAG: sulfate ABC transporter permease subunit CysT [Acidobacteria bacterium]|nr:sulfate ABC transporter permease subunit CysT [Acidobacteriota bacterium]MBU4330687.1 sulfate ABC transporter permease subunit CysT [Acidobacteriota bacterium]MBU4495348.1 sulfate ABC transporter permease subunit CysT [Acidobacteriota bacterium]